jgi:hypothetical protein
MRLRMPGWWPGGARWSPREDQIGWLQEYQRDLEQQAAGVAEEIRRLREGQQPAS